jgi:hypothetical protein
MAKKDIILDTISAIFLKRRFRAHRVTQKSVGDRKRRFPNALSGCVFLRKNSQHGVPARSITKMPLDINKCNIILQRNQNFYNSPFFFLLLFLRCFHFTWVTEQPSPSIYVCL